MRVLPFVLILGVAGTFVEAQDQPKQAPAPAADQKQAPQLDKDTETRIRTERSVGGVGNVTPEERANANVGAGPHKQFKPEGAARREPQEEPSQRDAGRGATR